jgi:hypothetical protein
MSLAQWRKHVKLKDLLKKVEGLSAETVVCIAEVDEAFGSEIADVEVTNKARERSPDAAEQEKVDLTNGDQTVVVIRW